MATIFGKSYSTPRNVNLKDGILRFGKTHSSNPVSTDTTGSQLYLNSSKQLCFWDGSSSTILGSAGSVVSYSLNDAYDDGKEITVDGAAVTLTGTHATNNTLVVTATGGSGNAIDISNAGSGYDIIGTSDTWSISAAGAAVLTAITGCDSLTAAANLTLEATSTGTVTIAGTSTGAVAIAGGGGATTIGGTLTVTGGADADAFIITAGDVLISDGHITMVQPDNEASIELTCAGVTSSYGLKITADGLTSGSAIYVDSDNGASFSGQGGYMHFYNGTTTDLFVGRYGAMTITGNAEGTASLTLTAGDLVLTDGALVITAGAFTYTAGDMTMSDGSLAITDADNAASFTVTNNNATSESVVVLAGSGVFTGTTTKSWMTITPSGLTTGTGVYAIGAGLTEGKLIHLATDATMTSGTILNVQCTGADSAVTSGMAASFDLTSTGIASSVNKTGSVVSITSNRTVTTGGTTADDFDLLSVIKATTRSAGTAATAGSAIYAEVQSTGTVTETSNGIEVVMDSGGTGDGVKITHNAVDGKALNIVSAVTVTNPAVLITANSLTTGTALTVSSSGTIITTGELVSLVGNSATTCTGLLRISGTGLTDGFAAQLTGGGANATSSGGVLDIVAGAATDGAALRVTTTGDYTGTVGVVDITANTATSGVIVDVSATSLTTGTALKITTNTTATGNYINCYDGAATDFKVSRYGATTIAGNAATDVFTITAGHAVITSGNLTLTAGNATLTNGSLVLTANSSVISFTGTGTNGGLLTNLYNDSASALSGTQRDVKIMIGATPYYFTVYPNKA